MTDNEWEIFETNLIKKYETDPNAELAEALIKEYAAHMINKTDYTKELGLHIAVSYTHLTLPTTPVV